MKPRLKIGSTKLMLLTACFAYALSFCSSICLSEAKASVLEKPTPSSTQHDCCSSQEGQNNQEPANTEHNCCQGHGAKYILEKQNLDSPAQSVLYWIPHLFNDLALLNLHETKTFSLYTHPPTSLFKVALYLEECELLI